MMQKLFTTTIVVVFAVLTLQTLDVLRAADWPQFRGPTGQGYSTATNIPLKWSETENVSWRTEIPGRGWSSPVVEGDKIYLTTSTVEEDDENELTQKLKNGVPYAGPKSVDMFVIVVDRKTGKVLHHKKVLTADHPQSIHNDNSYATPTPVVENGRLYCHFGGLGNACYDIRTNEVVWTNTDLPIDHQNGPGSSPILWHDFVIFHRDGREQQSIVALHKSSGKVAWETPRSGEITEVFDLKKSCATPLMVTMQVAGKQQEVICSPSTEWLYFYDPASGKELWRVSYNIGSGYSIVPRPVAGHGMIFMLTSFGKSELLAVKIDGKEPDFKPSIVWRYSKQAPFITSPLIVGDHIYIVHESGVTTCLDAKTGKKIWIQRIAGKFTSSPTLIEGKILICNQDGDMIFFKPGTKYEEITKNKLDGMIKASAIPIDHELYIRTDKALYRIEDRQTKAK